MIKYGVIKIKDLRKAIWLLFIGLLTAVVIYPFLHELGHSLATIILGGKVVEFHLFPLPNMLCDGSRLNNNALAFIGLCGMLFPFLISAIIKIKQFTFWYMLQLLKGISILAFVLSLISIFGIKRGICIANDDIVTALRFYPNGKTVFTALIILLIVWAVFSILRQRPIRYISKYFGINEK